MKTKYPLTTEHRQAFAHYLTKWGELLGLRDWRVCLLEGTCPDAMADVQVRLGDRLARVRLGKTWGEPVTDEALESTALHELLHVLLEPLTAACASKNADWKESAEHAVITVLEQLLMHTSLAEQR